LLWEISILSLPTQFKKNMYHEMFAEIGLDNSWNELGIDVAKQNTHNALKPEGVRYLFIPLIESCAKFLHIES
jgi:hypothetical protein